MTSCLIKPVSKIRKWYTSIDCKEHLFVRVVVCISKITVVLDFNQILRLIKSWPSLYHFVMPLYYNIIKSELVRIVKWNKVLILNIANLLRQIYRFSHIFGYVPFRFSLFKLCLSLVFYICLFPIFLAFLFLKNI